MGVITHENILLAGVVGAVVMNVETAFNVASAQDGPVTENSSLSQEPWLNP